MPRCTRGAKELYSMQVDFLQSGLIRTINHLYVGSPQLQKSIDLLEHPL